MRLTDTQMRARIKTLSASVRSAAKVQELADADRTRLRGAVSFMTEKLIERDTEIERLAAIAPSATDREIVRVVREWFDGCGGNIDTHDRICIGQQLVELLESEAAKCE